MFRSLARLARGKTSVTVPIGHVQKLGERLVRGNYLTKGSWVVYYLEYPKSRTKLWSKSMKSKSEKKRSLELFCCKDSISTFCFFNVSHQLWPITYGVWIEVPTTSIDFFSSEFKIGQHFIHSNLNYRGVVLFPVKEDIYIYNEKTRDYFPKKTLDCYHVLVDKRDLNESPNAIYKELTFTDRNSSQPTYASIRLVDLAQLIHF